MSFVGPFKIAAKHLIGAVKGVKILGAGFISPKATIRGRGTVTLHDRSRVMHGAEIQVNRGGLVELGDGAAVRTGVIILAGEGRVMIGEDATLANYGLVYGHGNVSIGKRALIGNHTLISSVDHTYDGTAPVGEQPMRWAPVVIEDDVWIGGHCIVLAGARIGRGAIVGSHSLVKGEVPALAVVGGVPARLIRMREEA